MSGHTRWENIRRLPDPHAREVQMAYVDGYRMGVEDSLKELNAYQARVLDREELKDLSPGLITTTLAMFKGARKVVARGLVTANETLKLLKG